MLRTLLRFQVGLLEQRLSMSEDKSATLEGVLGQVLANQQIMMASLGLCSSARA